jgi:hypothetical protein
VNKRQRLFREPFNQTNGITFLKIRQMDFLLDFFLSWAIAILSARGEVWPGCSLQVCYEMM